MNRLLETGISFQDFSPKTAGSGMKPPSQRTGVGMFDSNGGDIPPNGNHSTSNPEPEASEQQLFNALNKELEREMQDPSRDPFLLRSLDRTLLEFGLDAVGIPVGVKREQSFMDSVRNAGLIKRPRKLSLREYFGTMPSIRDIF